MTEDIPTAPIEAPKGIEEGEEECTVCYEKKGDDVGRLSCVRVMVSYLVCVKKFERASCFMHFRTILSASNASNPGAIVRTLVHFVRRDFQISNGFKR